MKKNSVIILSVIAFFALLFFSVGFWVVETDAQGKVLSVTRNGIKMKDAITVSDDQPSEAGRAYILNFNGKPLGVGAENANVKIQFITIFKKVIKIF